MNRLVEAIRSWDIRMLRCTPKLELKSREGGTIDIDFLPVAVGIAHLNEVGGYDVRLCFLRDGDDLEDGRIVGDQGPVFTGGLESIEVLRARILRIIKENA